tara:strand:+ start:529 stop:1326 length:798 start_codon:yes stop_codon:yes gene_type:complete
MAIDENDPRLKDMLRNIELGDIPEDLPADPEDYDDMGGIKSLDTMQMASETPEEEFELELGGMFEEFQEAVKNGYKGTIEDYSKEYFGKKEKAPSIKLASGYKPGDFAINEDATFWSRKPIYYIENDPEAGNFDVDEVRDMLGYGAGNPDKQYAMGGRVNYNQGTPKQQIVEPPKSMQMDTTTGEGANIFKISDLMKERERGLLNKKQMDMQKIINDQKAKDRASKMDMRKRDSRMSDIQRIKEMIKKAQDDKLKRAKGGIAGVL